MFIRKTIFSTNLILCIIIYVIKLRQILKNENIEQMDKHTEKLYFIKQASGSHGSSEIYIIAKNKLKQVHRSLPHKTNADPLHRCCRYQ